MQSALSNRPEHTPYSALCAAELLALLAEKDRLLQEKVELLHEKIELLTAHEKLHTDDQQRIREQAKHILLLEEYLRLAKLQRFGASSEKVVFQSDLFDEAELEVTLGE